MTLYTEFNILTYLLQTLLDRHFCTIHTLTRNIVILRHA